MLDIAQDVWRLEEKNEISDPLYEKERSLPTRWADPQENNSAQNWKQTSMVEGGKQQSPCDSIHLDYYNHWPIPVTVKTLSCLCKEYAQMSCEKWNNIALCLFG